MLLGCLALITGGSAFGARRASPLPGALTQTTTNPVFAVRPPTIIFTGDGSQIIGGPHGTGNWRDIGNITWLKWTRHEAIGLGAAWDRCIDARGCPTAYIAERQPVRFRLFAPAHGHFTRVSFGAKFGMHVVKVTDPGVGSYYMWFPDD